MQTYRFNEYSNSLKVIHEYVNQ